MRVAAVRSVLQQNRLGSVDTCWVGFRWGVLLCVLQRLAPINAHAIAYLTAKKESRTANIFISALL